MCGRFERDGEEVYQAGVALLIGRGSVRRRGWAGGRVEWFEDVEGFEVGPEGVKKF